MSLDAFKKRLEETLRHLLWRQWSRIGVAGTNLGDDQAILDPEALILFTLEAGRSDPRLFDEMLDWLLRNGKAIDVQRLRNIHRQDPDGSARLLFAVASLLAEHEKSAKWSRLAQAPTDVPQEGEPLFWLGDRTHVPDPRRRDPHFERAGYVRSAFVPRRLSGNVPRKDPACLRFRLRALFGIGIRAEIIAFLLAHEGGVNGDAVARSIDFSPPGTQEALREMEASDLVLSRREGREKRYFVSRDRWCEFLDLPPPVIWVNWVRLFRGLARVLRFLRRPDFRRMTEYVQASEFARAAKGATDDFEATGLSFHLPRQEGGDFEAHVSRMARAIEKLVAEL